MWPIVAACIDAGFTTLAPTLPGHGTDPADLIGVTWSDWLEAARGLGRRRGRRPVDGRRTSPCNSPPSSAAEQSCASTRWLPTLTRSRACNGGSTAATPGSRSGRPPSSEIAYERLPIEAVIAMTAGVAEIDLAAVDQPVLLVTSAQRRRRRPGVVRRHRRRACAATCGGYGCDNSGHVATLATNETCCNEPWSSQNASRSTFVSGSTGSRPRRDR